MENQPAVNAYTRFVWRNQSAANVYTHCVWNNQTCIKCFHSICVQEPDSHKMVILTVCGGEQRSASQQIGPPSICREIQSAENGMSV